MRETLKTYIKWRQRTFRLRTVIISWTFLLVCPPFKKQKTKCCPMLGSNLQHTTQKCPHALFLEQKKVFKKKQQINYRYLLKYQVHIKKGRLINVINIPLVQARQKENIKEGISYIPQTILRFENCIPD